MPLLVIITLGMFAGSIATLPPFNPGDAPAGSVIATTALLTFLITISTLCTLAPYAVSALAELKHCRRSGSGLRVLLWGLLLGASGIPLFYLFNSARHRT